MVGTNPIRVPSRFQRRAADCIDANDLMTFMLPRISPHLKKKPRPRGDEARLNLLEALPSSKRSEARRILNRLPPRPRGPPPSRHQRLKDIEAKAGISFAQGWLIGASGSALLGVTIRFASM